MRWQWQLLKDVLLTGTGIAVIVTQVFSKDPNGLLLAAGMGLTAQPLAVNIAGLLGSGESLSHPRAQAHGHLPPAADAGSSPPGSPPESAGERGGE